MQETRGKRVRLRVCASWLHVIKIICLPLFSCNITFYETCSGNVRKFVKGSHNNIP